MQVPKRLQDVEIQLSTNEHSALRHRLSHEQPLSNQKEIRLDILDRDYVDIEIVRYQAPILIVKAVDKQGKSIADFRPRMFYKTRDNPKDPDSRWINGIEGDVNMEKQEDGRWRSEQLLPDEPFELKVAAEGYSAESQQLSLPEGVARELQVVLRNSSDKIE